MQLQDTRSSCKLSRLGNTFPGFPKPLFPGALTCYEGEGEGRGGEIPRITQEGFGQLRSGAASPLAALRSSSVGLSEAGGAASASMLSFQSCMKGSSLMSMEQKSFS